MNQLCRGSFYRDGKRSILGMLTPADFQGGQWGYEFQNEWSRCRRHTACRFTVVLRVIKSVFSKFKKFRRHVIPPNVSTSSIPLNTFQELNLLTCRKEQEKHKLTFDNP